MKRIAYTIDAVYDTTGILIQVRLKTAPEELVSKAEKLR